jgi:2-polyprenyl-6-methoxyphenol hydroxylase-like FAD-dependent oxidoreductase
MTVSAGDGNSVPGDKTKVIIVGAGFGGLTAAVECHRRGLHVEIYEAFPELKVLGDIISFGPNAGRIFARWQQTDSDESIAIKLKRECIDLSTYGFRIHKYDTGEVVAQQPASVPSKDAPTLNGHRGELHEIVFNYVKDQLDVPIHLGQRVAEYFETDDGAGIILENGEKVRHESNHFRKWY